MATIKFRVHSKSENAPIYLRLSLGRNNAIIRKTSISINPKNWNPKKGMPATKYADDKNITSTLRNLSSFVLDEVNVANIGGTEINGDWLVSKINLHFNKTEVEELDYLTNFGEYFITNLKYKTSNKKKTGVSRSTEKKYRTIVNKLIAFDLQHERRTKLTDVNIKFRSELIDYFKKIDKLSDNTIGRYLKFVKTICLDAKKNGHKTSDQLEYFHGFTIEVPKVILSFSEIEQIKDANLISEAHQIARDWLIIGCFTGQRVSDLLRMKSSFIEHIQDYDFIVLEQIKTQKTVQIPIHPEVQAILDKRSGEFPPVFAKSFESSKTMFNRYLKKICMIAGINEISEGKNYDFEEKMNVWKGYPKHKLVSSHICRRSFASNFYGTELYPTPILMNITAHSTEKDFLGYIGKKPIDYSVQLAKIWQKLGKKKKQSDKKKADLKVVKKLSV